MSQKFFKPSITKRKRKITKNKQSQNSFSTQEAMSFENKIEISNISTNYVLNLGNQIEIYYTID